jgi:hypothetical protein
MKFASLELRKTTDNLMNADAWAWTPARLKK